MAQSVRTTIVYAMILSLVVLSLPSLTIAADAKQAVPTGENAACKGCKTSCPKTATNCKLCSSISCGGKTAGGAVSGKCVSDGVCEASKASTPGGGNMDVGGLGQLLGAIAQMMNALKGQPQGGGAPTSGTQRPSIGCTTYTQVSTPSADPCAYYVPSSASNINLSEGLDTGTGESAAPNPVSDLLNSLLGNTNTNTNTNSNENTSSDGSTASGGVSSTTSSGATGIGPDGASGDILTLPNGATVYVRNENAQGNSVIAGFMGAPAGMGNQPQSLVASWCRSRPWASNFLSFIIPATFFDSLCTLRGLPLGMPVSDSAPGVTQVGLTQVKVPSQVATSAPGYQPTPPSPQIEVDIWASPASVPLGSRTTIFWSSRNAASCTETSPDGSFSHSSLSGGGATVPLSGPTTFTMSCVAPDGTHATDYVTVNLSL
jgi:hypothetical protein